MITKRKNTAFRADPEIFDRLTKCAKKNGRSLNSELIIAAKAHLEAEESRLADGKKGA